MWERIEPFELQTGGNHNKLSTLVNTRQTTIEVNIAAFSFTIYEDQIYTSCIRTLRAEMDKYHFDLQINRKRKNKRKFNGNRS